MNKNIINSFLAAGLTLALASCGENTWNDHYLDGFEGGVDYNKPTTTEGEYTLTKEDYTTISKALAAVATTDEEKKAAAAIGNNLYFDKNSVYPAPVAIPYLMVDKGFPYYLDATGSNVAMTYDEADAVPAEIAALSAAKQYTLSKTDYAKGDIAKVLTAEYPNAAEGDYAVVSYDKAMLDEAQTAKAAARVSRADDFTMTNVLGSLTVGENIDITGYVAAVSTQGPIVTDAAGSVFVYLPTNNNDLKVGDQVSFEASVATFNTAYQIAKGSTFEVLGSQDVTYPTPRTWTAAEIDAFVAAHPYDGNNLMQPIYSTFTGTATVGSFINIILEGTSVQVSPYGASDAIKAQIPDGARVEVEGYFMALASRGKYLNTVITKVTVLPDENPVPTTSETYYFNGTTWEVAEGVTALCNADYLAMGITDGKIADAEAYLPLYLKQVLPYAQAGDQRYVVYNGTTTNLFVYDGSNWTMNDNDLKTVTARYVRAGSTWNFVKYLGIAVFNLFEQQQIELDRSYIFVCGDQCATPIASSKTYGYLTAVTVTVTNNQVNLPNDQYAFEFVTTYVNEEKGISVKCPEGTFLFKDTYGRYLYMSGSYNSPNVTDAPVINDGQIDETYLWTATAAADGTWEIMRGDRKMRLSISYGSFGFYAPDGLSAEAQAAPALYIMI